jgi:hypothetical protein
VPEKITFEFEMAIEKLKRRKSPGIDQIPGKLIKAGGRTIRSEINNLLIIFRIRRNCLEWNESIIVPIYKKGVIVVIIEAYQFYQLRTFYPHPAVKANSICR